MKVSRPRSIRVGDHIVSRRPIERSGLVGEVVAVGGRSGRPVTVLWEDGKVGRMTGYYIHTNPRANDGYLLLGQPRRSA